MKPIRILLIDPETLFRKGVAALLAAHELEVVADLPGTEEALDCSWPIAPDLVLMENMRTGLAGASAVGRLSEKWTNCRFAFLTNRLDSESITEWQSSRATGYILKDTSPEQLFHAIEVLAEGGAYRSAALEQREGMARTRPTRGNLTPREVEVLRLTAEGRSVKEVAGLLGLSAKTVDAHKVNLMRKLQIHNKAQLVQYAFQNNILTLQRAS